MRNADEILIGGPERTRLLGIPRRIWDDNINIDLIDTGCEDVEWIHLAQNRVHCRVHEKTVGPGKPSSSIKDG
jgi:hypothetical protein